MFVVFQLYLLIYGLRQPRILQEGSPAYRALNGVETGLVKNFLFERCLMRRLYLWIYWGCCAQILQDSAVGCPGVDGNGNPSEIDLVYLDECRDVQSRD